MMSRLGFGMVVIAALVATCGCTLPGKPAPGPEVARPDSILDPIVLYRQNCAGCHGADGNNGPAMALGDPVYLALVDDDTMRTTISKGRAGTAMSAFAQSEGGMLTAQQIDAVIHGIRLRWAKPDALAGTSAPPYAAAAPGIPVQGQATYATFCASCHGADNKGGPKAGSVTNSAYLSLISDQGLRSIVIAGRPDFGAPDWRGNVPGRPMTNQEITDVVSWFSSKRPKQLSQTPVATSSTTGGVH